MKCMLNLTYEARFIDYLVAVKLSSLHNLAVKKNGKNTNFLCCEKIETQHHLCVIVNCLTRNVP